MGYEDDEFSEWLDRLAEQERQGFLETMPALLAEDPPPVLLPHEVALYGFEGDLTVVEVDDPSCPPMEIEVPLLSSPFQLTDRPAFDPPSRACYRRVGGRVYHRVQ